MGDRGRTAFLAALAGGTGVGVENILPGKIGDLCRAELFGAFVFQVDGGDTPPGRQVGEQIIGGGGKNVAQLGEGNDDDEAHAQEEVDPPEYLMNTGQGLGCHAEEKELPEEHADRREERQAGIGHELGICYPQPFDDKASQQDGEQQRVHHIIVTDGIQTFRLYQEAADEKPTEHDQRNKAGHIKSQGEYLVENPFEEEPSKERLGEIHLGHDKKGADEQEAEAPEKKGVERAGAEHAKHLDLGKGVFQKQKDPLSQAVEPVQRLSPFIGGEAPVKAVQKRSDGNNGKEVHRQYDPVPDVPVYFPSCFHGVLPIFNKAKSFSRQDAKTQRRKEKTSNSGLLFFFARFATLRETLCFST
jgi:hypothetical protein